MSADADDLAARLRRLLPALAEKRIVGGIGFMLDGHLLVGTAGKGTLLVRVDPAHMEAALARPGASVMRMGKRVMAGYVAVAPEALGGAALEDWIAYARAFVETLPPK